MRRLLGDAWQNEFQMFQDRVNDINGRMKGHQSYLQTVYEQIKPELDAEVHDGAVLGHCYSCGFDAHVGHEVGPFDTTCRVCTAYGSFLSHKCDGCGKLFLVEEGDEHVECPGCGRTNRLTRRCTNLAPSPGSQRARIGRNGISRAWPYRGPSSRHSARRFTRPSCCDRKRRG